MAAKSLQELFVEELRDMYDAEKRLTKALPKMAKAAESDELQMALMNHLQETEGQVSRLEEVFRTLGEKPRGKKCDGIMGIVEESKTAMQELDGPILDAALIAGAQKAEHYEIASYGTLAYFADMLGHEQAKDLLGETLEEEKAADEKLNTIAKSKVNREALLRGMDDEAGEPGIFRATRPSRGARAMASANDRGGSRSKGSRSSSSSRATSRSRSSSKRGRR
ncbi:MAG TPA: ferritin-like domain-containing protein [Vicinamibacterales bacterium]|jgi:ferritin-like metal-binding protein YciE|nr:ferritin-like domain-containing protein [Vicinamibacterales bacterium]